MFPYSFMPPVRMMPPDGSSAGRKVIAGPSGSDMVTGGPAQSSRPIMEMQPGVADDQMVRARPVQRSQPIGNTWGLPNSGPWSGGGFGGNMGRFPFGLSQSLFGSYMGDMGYGPGAGGRQYQPQFQNSLSRYMGAYLPSNSMLSNPWLSSPEAISTRYRPLSSYQTAQVAQGQGGGQFNPYDTNRDGIVDWNERRSRGG